MGIQSALLGAAGAVAGGISAVKKAADKKADQKESPSSIAAQKAQASLAEHREAKKRSSYFVAPKLADVSGIKIQKGE